MMPEVYDDDQKLFQHFLRLNNFDFSTRYNTTMFQVPVNLGYVFEKELGCAESKLLKDFHDPK